MNLINQLMKQIRQTKTASFFVSLILTNNQAKDRKKRLMQAILNKTMMGKREKLIIMS